MIKKLKSLKEKLQIRNWLKFQCLDGGTDLYYITISLIYLGISIYGTVDYWRIISIESSVHIIPFILLSILLLTKIKTKIDIIADMLIMIIIISISIVGEFSGITLLYLLLFRSENKKMYTLFLFLCLLSISINAIIYNNSILETFKTLFMFGFFLLKYYFYLHLPTQKLKQSITEKDSTISTLNNRLSILGPVKKLTDAEIIDKYRFLKYTLTDKDGNDDPYRKLRIVRMLSDGYEYKEICSELSINDLNNLSRSIQKIRGDLSNRTGGTIINNTQLIKECIRLGIIHVDITP